jgi:hypothetical protein
MGQALCDLYVGDISNHVNQSITLFKCDNWWSIDEGTDKELTNIARICI